MRYLSQLRRGWKYDADPKTGKPRDDWAEYEKKPDAERKDPQPGELVVEYDNGVPRLKIGDGKSKFSELPYMSVDSFILPTPASITIYPDKWEQTKDEDGNVVENRYYQHVNVNNATITPSSKVDLQIKPEDLVVFHEKDLAFTAINTSGQVRICVIGQKPTQQYTLKATVMEVAERTYEIIGNTTATPNPCPDWNRTDKTKADYIKNKPAIKAGEGENSIVGGGNNSVALGESSVAIGSSTYAGQKGYYFKAIDLSNKKIYLTTEQPGKQEDGTGWIPSTTSFVPDSSFSFSDDEKTRLITGSWISILSYYDYHYYITINGFEGNNVLIYDGDLPSDFSIPEKEARIYRYSITFPEFPDIGDHSVSFASLAEGGETKALGRYSHAEGYGTVAIGGYGHAEGNSTKAGSSAHAEGNYTMALGHQSHAEGINTRAERANSHAEGQGTIAAGDESHAEGVRTADTKYTGSATVTVLETSYDKTRKAGGQASHAEGYDTTARGLGSHAEGKETLAYGNQAHAEGLNSIAIGEAAHAEGSGIAKGNQAHAEGSAKAYGNKSHAEGTATAYGEGSHAEGSATVTESGIRAHAEGDNSASQASYTFVKNFLGADDSNAFKAHGYVSHREGRNTSTLGNISHAEGEGTIAQGEHSHAEGYCTIAKGMRSHAEGANTMASASYSHAGGLGTKATAEAQTVVGKYNATDSQAKFVVGVGSSDTARANAFTAGNDGANDYITLGDAKLIENELATLKTHISMLNCISSDTKSGTVQLTQLGSKYSGTVTITVPGLVTGVINRTDGTYKVSCNGTATTITLNIMTLDSNWAIAYPGGYPWSITYYYIPIVTG